MIYVENGIWHVEVPNSIGSNNNHTLGFTTYEVDECIIVADKLLGRHTRCLLGHRLNGPDKTRYAIKDYWTIAEGEDLDTRDEVEIVDKINKDLDLNRPDLKGTYPTFVKGGIVRLRIGNGHVKDTTQLIPHPEVSANHNDPSANVSKANYCPTFRIHKRIVMTPCGQPLRKIKSIPELIIVLADVMAVYMAIAQRTGYLHRDISETNILFVGEGVNIRGVLIDFDNSVVKGRKGIQPRPTKSGAPLFRSIGSLEGLNCQRNELDDWESLLYLICCLGIYGINSIYRLTDVEKLKPRLGGWCMGSEKDIGQQKRWNLQNGSFKESVLEFINQKQPYWKELRELTSHLHKALFCSSKAEKKGRGYRTGTQTSGQTLDTSCNTLDLERYDAENKSVSDGKDPLMCRTNDEDV